MQLLIHLDRLTGGRRVVRIEKITGMEGESVCIQDIFTFNQTGRGRAGLRGGAVHGFRSER